jgi:NAD(P)-dependent dehydrogenase (short-subunit alcohol dehydrogenase family)
LEATTPGRLKRNRKDIYLKRSVIVADSKVSVIAGAGPGAGAALARRFAQGGYRVALLARNNERVRALAADIEGAKGYACDVADEQSVHAVFNSIVADLGPVDALLYNAGKGVWGDIESITPEDFEEAWRVNTLGALLCSRAVIPAMRSRGAGAIVFTGATASRRGNKKTAAFAPAKAAQRSLAESMARSLWPSGIHVGLIIVDGVIDEERTRKQMPDKPVDFFVDPAGIAEIAWHLVHQERRAWSFEVEARPFQEAW